jgi:hypothetical protein
VPSTIEFAAGLDFNIVAGNFGSSGATFSQGDFNHDGQVNLLNFNILAARFGQALPAAAAVRVGGQAAWTGFGQRLIEGLEDRGDVLVTA